MTPNEAAELLGISAQSVRQAIHRKRLKADIISGRAHEGATKWEITADEVERYKAHVAARHAAKCLRCGEAFDARASNHRYCSDECLRIAKVRARNGRKPDQAYLTRDCAECGEGMLIRRLDQRYCSPRCRQAAFFKKHGYSGSAQYNKERGIGSYAR